MGRKSSSQKVNLTEKKGNTQNEQVACEPSEKCPAFWPIGGYFRGPLGPRPGWWSGAATSRSPAAEPVGGEVDDLSSFEGVKIHG